MILPIGVVFIDHSGKSTVSRMVACSSRSPSPMLVDLDNTSTNLASQVGPEALIHDVQARRALNPQLTAVSQGLPWPVVARAQLALRHGVSACEALHGMRPPRFGRPGRIVFLSGHNVTVRIGVIESVPARSCLLFQWGGLKTYTAVHTIFGRTGRRSLRAAAGRVLSFWGLVAVACRVCSPHF